jgi:hypothetical protein
VPTVHRGRLAAGITAGLLVKPIRPPVCSWFLTAVTPAYFARLLNLPALLVALALLVARRVSSAAK